MIKPPGKKDEEVCELFYGWIQKNVLRNSLQETLWDGQCSAPADQGKCLPLCVCLTVHPVPQSRDKMSVSKMKFSLQNLDRVCCHQQKSRKNQ